jgi:hypothetical protein
MNAAREPMKLVTPTQLADPDAAARKLVKIASAVHEPHLYRAGQRHVPQAGGTPKRYRAALERAISPGCGSTNPEST